VIDAVTDVVLSNWEHPNRKVLHLMPTLFNGLLKLQFTHTASNGGGQQPTQVAGHPSAEAGERRKRKFEQVGGAGAGEGARAAGGNEAAGAAASSDSSTTSTSRGSDHALHTLVHRILAQPPHKKGKYPALNLLLQVRRCTHERTRVFFVHACKISYGSP
jgi:hypothetical protein